VCVGGGGVCFEEKKREKNTVVSVKFAKGAEGEKRRLETGTGREICSIFS
jgi:hypothetical protein